MLLNKTFLITINFFIIMLLSISSIRNTGLNNSAIQRNINFNNDWKFYRCDTDADTSKFYNAISLDETAWEKVTLPHTPKIEPLVVNDQWQGICWYRKKVKFDDNYRDKKIYIEFEAAMHTAEVWVNGKHKITHYGGYLPFTIDITEDVHFGEDNIIAVRLDNRDNPDVPPGKALKVLDFCYFGGLYRNVNLHITDKLHITDAVSADQTGGGGIFVKYPEVSKEKACVWVQTHVINEYPENKNFKIINRLQNKQGSVIAENISEQINLAKMEDKHIVQELNVSNPELWHPNTPYLYHLYSIILENDKIIDKVKTTIGIKRISFSASEGFKINGEKLYLRGTNHHQEYPYISYALPDNAHYRDAYKIKQAGFDYVRLSHYPHAPAFMDACDELGLVVMNCIPGWQHMGGYQFKKLCFQNCRDMMRRDRNHPSVILWEVSLNETFMDEEFLNKTQNIAREEYSGDQCYTCGWQDDYDIFIQARQHGGCKRYSNGDKACVISEYGDWEYYAQNAGLDQPGFRNLEPEERNSRQSRGVGEKRLLQQAMNFQEAHNDNYSSPAVGDGLWVMFDYNRGYADDIEFSGLMDIFRIPKFSYYFFKSQRPVNVPVDIPNISGPMVYIATYWMDNADKKVKVFSNCEQVSLILNEKEIRKQGSDRDQFSNNLNYPPFTFQIDEFKSGSLEAIGYIDGEKATSHKIFTPAQQHSIKLTTDLKIVKPTKSKKDVFFVYASILDENGTLVPIASNSVTFSCDGPGKLIGQNPVEAEAGIASILVESSGKKGTISLNAISDGLIKAEKIQISFQ